MVSSAEESSAHCIETEDHFYKGDITQDRPTDAGSRAVGLLEVEDYHGLGWQEVHCFVPRSAGLHAGKQKLRMVWEGFYACTTACLLRWLPGMLWYES